MLLFDNLIYIGYFFRIVLIQICIGKLGDF